MIILVKNFHYKIFKSVLFFRIRKIFRLHILNIFLHGTFYIIVKIKISSEKTRIKFMIKSKHVVKHEYLPVHTATSTNANDRNENIFCNLFGKISWDFFKNNGKATNSFQQFRII